MSKVHFPQKSISVALATFCCLNMEASSAGGYNALLQMIEQMPEKTWIQANQNTFQSVWTPPQYQVLPNSSYGSNISGIIRAWSSFAWDSNRGNLIIIYGGGHANYGGNDVYTWQSSNLQWVRSSLPTQIENISGYPEYLLHHRG